jgi:hypothetical protein
MAGVITLTLTPGSIIITGPTYAVAPLKGLLTFHPEERLLDRNCCSQNFAAPCAPTFDKIRTALGAHALTKTMSTFTTDFTWLIGTLHNRLDLLYLAKMVIFIKGTFKHNYKTKSRTKKNIRVLSYSSSGRFLLQ